MNSSISIAILIPCYNCGPAILDVVKGVREFSQNILIVNDGCTDDSETYIQKCRTPTIGWAENRGKGRALMEGFQYFLRQTDWNVLFTIDSDGQHSPADIPRFLEIQQRENAQIVIGKRNFNESCVPPIRRYANQWSSRLIASVSGCQIQDIQCGYRLFTRSALERIYPRVSSNQYAIETEMTLIAHDLKLRTAEVEIQCIYSAEATQRSSWRPVLDSWKIARVVVNHLYGKRPAKELANTQK